MKLSIVMLFTAVSLCLSVNVSAQSDRSLHAGDNPDVVIGMPAQVWNQGQSRQQGTPCQRCCIYDNRSYTEGAVVKAEGVLLQCSRDKQSLGTNNLVWRVMDQR